MKTGTLYGIGVGPGDPELIPVKSVRILSRMDTVFTAASSKNNYSLAVDIAGSHLRQNAAIEKLYFPMSKDPSVMETAWYRNAAKIANVLVTGQDAAFLTLGDPLTYSTYGYVLRCLTNGWPHLEVRTIPGITSYQAAAAEVNRPLVEGEESLLIMSGVHGGERLARMSDKPDNVVFLKAYRNIDGITNALDEAGMLTGSVAVANCSRENQEIYKDMSALGEKRPNYWTLIISGRKHEAHGK